MNGYWNNSTKSQPHTIAMMERSEKMFDEALRLAECNEVAQRHVYDPAAIADLIVIASELRKFALQPVVFAEAPGLCPVGLTEHCMDPDCMCRTAARVRALEPDDGCTCIDGSCKECQKRAGEIWTL